MTSTSSVWGEKGRRISTNGVAFKLAKRWMRIDSQDDEFTLASFAKCAKREETVEKPRDARLGLGATFLPHSKAMRTMVGAEEKAMKRVEKQRRIETERELDLRRAMEDESEDEEEEEGDVRGRAKVSNSGARKKKRVEAFSVEALVQEELQKRRKKKK